MRIWLHLSHRKITAVRVRSMTVMGVAKGQCAHAGAGGRWTRRSGLRLAQTDGVSCGSHITICVSERSRKLVRQSVLERLRADKAKAFDN